MDHDNSLDKTVGLRCSGSLPSDAVHGFEMLKFLITFDYGIIETVFETQLKITKGYRILVLNHLNLVTIFFSVEDAK